MNNLVYFYGYSGCVYDCDSFLQWAIENNLVYLRTILVGSMIMIVSWAIENNLVYLKVILVGL